MPHTINHKHHKLLTKNKILRVKHRQLHTHPESVKISHEPMQRLAHAEASGITNLDRLRENLAKLHIGSGTTFPKKKYVSI